MPDTRSSFDFGPFRLIPSERLLLRDGVAVPLREKLFDTLVVLAQSEGRLISKEDLLEAVWPQTHVEESNLAHNISVLRKTLGEGIIETIPKHGYRFVAPAARPVATPHHEPHRIIAVAAIIVLFSVSCYLVLREVEARSVQPIRSIAILPLRTLGSRPQGDFLGYGIADTLITRLSATRQLAVRSITAVSRYAGPSRDPIEAGKRLEVDAVLDGQIQQSGSDLRTTLQLVSVQHAVPLWSAPIDGKAANLFQLEDAIASALLNASPLGLKGKAFQPPPSTTPAEAHEAYLKGRYYWNRRTHDDFRIAAVFFRRALERDPNYALAWAGLADTYNMTGGEAGAGRAAALRALQLDSSLAPAHTALANVYLFQDWNFPAAERELRRAIELDPNYATAHHWYAFHLAASGNLTAALAEIHRARDCDPTSVIINTDIGQILYYGRRYDEAVSAFQSALEMDHGFVQAHLALGECYEQAGRYEEAARELTRAGRFGLQGDKVVRAARDGAQAYWAVRSGEAAAEEVRYFRLAQVSLRRGRRDEALALLNQSFEHHEGEFILLGIEPAFDPLRGDPRFQALVANLGIDKPPRHS